MHSNKKSLLRKVIDDIQQRSKMACGSWNKHDPGNYPVCIIGAGFQLGVLKDRLPSTDDMIERTMKCHGRKFPTLRLLYNEIIRISIKEKTPILKLNFFCTYKSALAYIILDYCRKTNKDIIEYTRHAYSSQNPLIENLINNRLEPIWKDDHLSYIQIILGIEFNRMLALQYKTSNIRLKDRKKSDGLRSFIERKDCGTTWISTNYDTVLETLLNKYADNLTWKYFFEDLFEAAPAINRSPASHVVTKPHGSLNIWFKSIWGSPVKHSVGFADKSNRLETFPEDKIGCPEVLANREVVEYRPWVIAYQPDYMKGELNSPLSYADSAHELSKTCVGFASLSLQKATSLYILGHSMPPEDEWMWNRISAILENKKLPIYVASGKDTCNIIKRLEDSGFQEAKCLTDNGYI